jgi:chromosome segregation ATPase
MAAKRTSTAGSPKRSVKRARVDPLTKLIPTVVDAVTESEALPADLRTLFKATLPIVFSSNKADRHAFEAEVVAQAEQALKAVTAEASDKQKAALSKQQGVTSLQEHERRTNSKKAAEAALEAAKAKVEASKEARHTGQKSVDGAQSALKAAQKESAAMDKEIKHHEDDKAKLVSLEETEFVLLRDGSSHGAAGKKAVQKISALGKTFGLDHTLLQAFPEACKKPDANRSEFEKMIFDRIKAGIERNIGEAGQKLAEAEPVKAQKESAVASAKDALEKAEAALKAAEDELAANQTAQKEGAKDVSKADKDLHRIWSDMREACDAQDEMANELKRLQEDVSDAFQKLREREPEPEPVEEPEPVVEEAAAAEPAVAAEA